MFEGLFEPAHLILILAIILIVFGAGKLPEVGGGIGKSISEFRRGVREVTSDPPGEPQPMVERQKLVVPPVTITSQVCANCGASISAGAHFCASCGSQVAA